MTTGKIFERIGAVTPSIAAGWVSAWTDLFEKTAIVRPGADERISDTGAAVATFVAIVTVLLFQSLPSAKLKRLSIVFLTAFVGLGVACYSMRFFLNRPYARDTGELLFYTWDSLYVIFMVVMVVTILFATLFALSKDRQSL